MSISTRMAQVALLVCSAVGIYGTYYFASINGTFDFMTDLRASPVSQHVLPGTKERIRETFTGISAIDNQLAILGVFFWPIVDGSNPGASIQCVHFAGQFGAAYLLVLLEGMRNSNKGRIISYIAVWGLIYQNVAYAVTMPLYLLIHTLTSPSVSPTPANLHAPAAEVAALIPSVTLGYVIPSFLMALPFPSVVTSDRKQIYMAIWQVFPIWVALIQQVFKRVLAGSSTTLSRSSPGTTKWCFRMVYALALALGGSTHLPAVTLASAKDFFAPLFGSAQGGLLSWRQTFVPIMWLPGTKVASLSDGAALFLQYDEYVGSAGMVIWALFMLARSWPSGASKAAPAVAVVAGLGSGLVSGPVVAATILMWIRDEIVLEGDVSQGKKN